MNDADTAMSEAAIRAAREHNARARIHRKLSNENLCNIFLALTYLDTPSLANPQGWYLQINGVCHFWREVALHYAELWARSAGSFPSQRMTDLAIQRAGASRLSFSGHFEDHGGPGHVLTDYQLLLVEKYASRLRSLGHDDYWAWSELFYCIRAFPELEVARIWDDSGSDEWSECIDTPRLQSLYMNNVLIPFNAPALRYLRVDMDNIHWRSSRDIFNTSEPATEGCEAIPRVFPTREFIAFLQRSPALERLTVTNMPLLFAKQLPIVRELHAELPNLRGLHLSGKSGAMGDFWQRLRVSPGTQVSIDTDYLDDEKTLHPELQELVTDHLISSVYDSLKLGMTPSYDLVLQMWSSEAHGAQGPELSTSLEVKEPSNGPAFNLRLPVGTCSLLETYLDKPVMPETWDGRPWMKDPFLRLQQDLACDFFDQTRNLLRSLSSSTLKFFDLTGMPFVEHYRISFVQDEEDSHPEEHFMKDHHSVAWGGTLVNIFSRKKNTRTSPRGPADTVRTRWTAIERTSVSNDEGRLLDQPGKHLMHSPKSSGNVVLRWTLIKRTFESDDDESEVLEQLGRYLPHFVGELTIVDFPCASFPSQKRYDENYNAKAWDILFKILKEHSIHKTRSGNTRVLSLKLAESASELSNMERSEEPEYVHTIEGSYEDAVRAVTEKGYQHIAPFVRSFEDLRAYTWS